jgi:hypothetical protein
MATKKRSTKKAPVKKATVKRLLAKPAPKTRKRKVAKVKTGRRALDRVGEVFVVREGENVTIHVTVAPEIQEVTLTVNGRGVYRGQP